MSGGWGLREQLLDVGEEAEVEHLVGLVEHHHRDVFQRKQPLAGEVEKATGRADDDLSARLELLDLPLVGLAAIDRGDLGGAVGCGEREIFGHLHAQFAGRNDDECLHARGRVGAERLQQWQPETQCFAGAGLGLADDVLPVQPHRNRLGLNGERFDDSLGGERVDHVLVDVQICKSQAVNPVVVANACAHVVLGRRYPRQIGGVPPL